MRRRRLIATAVVAAALLSGGIVLGAYAFPRTETKVLVEARTLTVEASPSNERTLHVQILDDEPRQAGATTDTPFPLAECETDSRFPRIEDVAVYEPSDGNGLGTLVGLPDSSTLAYAPIADEGICTMQFDVPDLAPARFYVVHAGSDTRLFEGGYNWRLSAAELERNDWSISLRLGS
jgi:hypothetical protein